MTTPLFRAVYEVVAVGESSGFYVNFLRSVIFHRFWSSDKISQPSDIVFCIVYYCRRTSIRNVLLETNRKIISPWENFTVFA